MHRLEEAAPVLRAPDADLAWLTRRIRETLSGHAPGLYRIPSAFAADVERLVPAGRAARARWIASAGWPERAALLAASGVRVVVTTDPPPAGARLVAAVPGAGPDARVLVLDASRGAAWLARRWATAPTVADLRRTMLRPGHDPVADVLLSGERAEGISEGARLEIVPTRRWDRERFVVTAPSQACLVLTTTGRGWITLLDGRPAVTRPANGIAEALLIPQGRHEVARAYHAPGLRAGAAISAAAWLALGLAAALSRSGRTGR